MDYVVHLFYFLRFLITFALSPLVYGMITFAPSSLVYGDGDIELAVVIACALASINSKGE